MESLLRHMVELTGQRDHNLLDVAIISALQEMVGASQVRMMDIFRTGDEALVRARAWITNGTVTTIDESTADHRNDTPLTHYPVLLECIAHQGGRVEEIGSDGETILWVPIWQNDIATACLQITGTTTVAPAALHVMEGILSVYRNYQNLLDYSERDSLTGLLNRRTFDEKFSRMASSQTVPDSHALPNVDRRHPNDVEGQWLAVVDIDHFKRVNDQFGHLYGDEVLILVANLLRSSFRTQDLVFRFGGEEFVILLRSVSLNDASSAFERLRANIEEHYFPQLGTITVSIGFVSINSSTPVVILGHADQALYYGKSNGRNQVCFYDELVRRGQLHSEVINDHVEFFFDN
ncbi:GGDEF domain-containing protein [Actimicrobium sp. CCI2.3]|uniref:GGDEF domain-containing protein n=1 Tax=Actimicrobium sp. CCI2.3 TaxID=3048616 RepID=UPI002AB44C3E|nr:GGDEF domain-containing protein [Actimicrobium sp. CCI2.3]MDY7573239.1 GGDEF domain-containing protein [Actimicrobium sp. CCI2.3]MEB0022873.1 GGDEF domain-containing protein [Actimicrobium sp. CCI2.3]